MPQDLDPDLAVLFDSPDPELRTRAWSGFLGRYNRLLLKAMNGLGGDYDARMDRYQYVVDALAEENFRRLRAYRPDSRSAFPAWLTVVARRLCVDFERARHGRGGRATAEPERAREVLRSRRRLADLIPGPIDADQLPASDDAADDKLHAEERHRLVERVLAELPTRDRLLLRWRFEEQQSIRAIRDLMGFPTVFHVYRRLQSVLAELRNRLRAVGIDDTT